MRPRPPSRRIAWLAAALVLVAAGNAAAEGRFCGDKVEGGVAAGSTEEEATFKAQRWWSSRAGSLGRGYENWDNANDRDVKCKGGNGDGVFHCKATARPCLPPGVLPENVPKLEM